jgi:hypothetical protein
MLTDALTFASIAASVVGSAVGIVVVGVRARAYSRRSAGHAATPARLDADRLARLELAVDGIALEVERIGEGQRFLTRLHAAALDQRAPGTLSGGAEHAGPD